MSARFEEQPGWVGRPCECGDGYAPCQYDSNDECIACGRVWRAAAPDVENDPLVAKTALAAAPGSAHPVGAVVCSHCGCACRSDEAQHYDHGDGCEGWECEPCQQEIKEWSHMQYLRFLKRVEELKAKRAAAGSGKDAQNDGDSR